MTDHEFIIVESYHASVHLDDYNKGEIGSELTSWSNATTGLQVNDKFKTISDALEAVCEANCFKYKRNHWEFDELNMEFFSDFLVDGNNFEASPDEIETWKKGKLNLYSCRLTVKLRVRTDDRIISLDEVHSENW